MNLTDLLTALSDLDNAGDVEFDPEQVVGDLKDKVDAIHTIMGRLLHEHARLRTLSMQFSQAATQIEKSRERLQTYLLFAMRGQGFEKLPGNTFRVQIQKAPPSLEVERAPTADDVLAMPAFVERKVEYRWKKDEIKAAIADGSLFPYGRIVQSEYPKFYINKGAEK